MQSASELGSRICGGLLQCARKLRLYPEAHPRVQERVRAIKAELLTYSHETGQPFSIHTGATLEGAVHGSRQCAETAEVTLGRLLKIHLIESVALLPEITDEEVIQFCEILQEDFAKACAEGEDTPFDPDDWGNIRLSFYTPQDFPGVFPSQGAPLERAAGARRLKDMQVLFDAVGAETRDALQGALSEPAFLKKVSGLRRALRKRRSAWGEQGGKKVDLFSEVLRSVLTTPEVVNDPGSAREKVLSAIQDLVKFLESNVQGLALNLQTLRDGADANPLDQQVRAALSTGPTLAAVVNNLQLQKQRLGFLFQADATPAVAAPDESSTGGSAEPEREKPLKDVPGQEISTGPGADRLRLEERLGAIRYDVDELRELADKTTAFENYLHAVLELLSRNEHREAVGKLKSLVSLTVTQSAAGGEALQRALMTICESIRNTENRYIEDLLVEILYRAPSPQATLQMLESSVLPLCGPRVAVTCLIRLTERDPRKAMALLFAAHKESRTTLRSVAEARLITVATKFDLAVQWALEYPDGLLIPRIFTRVVEGLGPERTLKAFRIYFANAKESQAARVVQDIPARIADGESVLFAALEIASSTVRNLAVANLGKFPTPAVIATLSEIVKANNYKDAPDMEEVTSALKALLATKERSASEFLGEVLRQRRGLSHAYRKEIRRALQNLSDSRKKTP